jgi:hypothetical protein
VTRKKRPLESAGVEEPFVDYVESCGYWALKLNPLGRVGIPDRLVIGPGRFIAFFELKRLGRKPSPIQRWFHRKLREFGFHVVVPDSKEDAIAQFHVLVDAHVS